MFNKIKKEIKIQKTYKMVMDGNKEEREYIKAYREEHNKKIFLFKLGIITSMSLLKAPFIK